MRNIAEKMSDAHLPVHPTLSLNFCHLYIFYKAVQMVLGLSISGSRYLWGDQLWGSNQLHIGITWEPLGAWHPDKYNWNCGGVPHGVRFDLWEMVDTFSLHSRTRWMMPKWSVFSLFRDVQQCSAVSHTQSWFSSGSFWPSAWLSCSLSLSPHSRFPGVPFLICVCPRLCLGLCFLENTG